MMFLHISPVVPDGPLPVHTNTAHGDSFGVIHLGDAELIVHTDEEAHRIIAAAARVTEMRAALGGEHEFRPGAGPDGRHCAVCGDLDDEDHWRKQAEAS